MATTKYLIIIAGPTAVGKTNLSLKIAKSLDTEIISADSRQYYRELNIGTAKPSQEELTLVKHHFIDSLSIHDHYSIGQFERDVTHLLQDRFKYKDAMIMTGGSGMHIRAISHGLDIFPVIPSSVRDKFILKFMSEGIRSLQMDLMAKDPEYAQIVDLENPHRLIRALSVIKVSDLPFSSYLRKEPQKRSFQVIYLMLGRDREELYDRINTRVDLMISKGLEAEAQSLISFKHLQALKTIGYKELFDYFDNKIDRETAIELIKRNSRRYAKRQLTWFRKEKYWNRWYPHQEVEIQNYIKSMIQF